MSLVKREHHAGGWPFGAVWPQELIDSDFREMLRSMFGESATEKLVDRARMMRLEEYVEGTECVIRAELPGIDPDKDVEITVSDGVLTMTAERKERSEETRRNGYRSEFRYGHLHRSIRLPEGTTGADVAASYHDGILEIRVPAPKAAAPEAARIAIAHD